jgi:hypothetical protein
MYKDINYVASNDDERALRDALREQRLNVVPERPGQTASLAEIEVRRNNKRLLSLRPPAELKPDPNPFPHYSPACNPLLEWRVPYTNGKLIVAGWMRHHFYMEKDGPAFVEVGKAFADIRKWMKLNWAPINRFDFIGPGARKMVDAQGYTWASFDPNRTSFVVVRANGVEEEVSYAEWLSFTEDEARRRGE